METTSSGEPLSIKAAATLNKHRHRCNAVPNEMLVIPVVIMNRLTGSAQRKTAIPRRPREHGRLDNWAF